MDNTNSWLQLAAFFGVLLLLTKPLGLYIVQVLDPRGRTWFDRVIGPFERLTYRAIRIDPAREQNWFHYLLSLLVFTIVGGALTYAILRLQDKLPFNPQHLPAVAPALALNTAVSFATNTNWQSYGGETTMSYFSQMVALTLHNFTSAAAGIAVAAALVRGLARQTSTLIGNFWVDVVRTTYYLLLPLSFVLAIALMSQGMIQNFRPYTAAKTLSPFTTLVAKTDAQGQVVNGGDGKPVLIEQHIDSQTIAQGPVASQVAIKMLGTNGGGFFNANAAHPYENPTPLSNFLQMLAIFAIPSALTYYLGRLVKNQRHGWALWWAMALMCLAGVLACWYAEQSGNPIHHHLGVATSDGNLEGKEVRFGIFDSSLFTTLTTDASCGAVNTMHDSLTPLGGFITLFNMMTGEVIFGGVGAGLYSILLFVILAVFIAGLMVGRTPEYLGKKIEAYDVKLVMVILMILAAALLGFTAWSCLASWGAAGLNNSGPHGFSELLYAFTSCVANNGSAFAGLTVTPADGDPHWNLTLAAAMAIGRFLMIAPILALAGNLASKRRMPASAGTFETEGVTFVILLIGTVVLVGALTHLPALAVGPIVEHFLMNTGQLF